MDLKEAYKVMQENCGIEVGDKVKVLRMPKSKDEMGWNCFCFNSENSDRHYMVGKIGTVRDTRDASSISVKYENGICGADRWPFFCLELVEKAKPKPPPIYVGDHEVEFLDGKIRVCDVNVSKGTLKQIYDRLEN